MSLFEVKVKKSGGSGLAVMVLSGVWAVLALLAAALGVRAYRSVSALAEVSFGGRTAALYIEQKLRHYDRSGISVERLGGGPALVLAEKYGGEDYVTYIYCADGMIRELFTPSSAVPDFGAGEPIAAADALDLYYIKVKGDIHGDILKAKIVCGDETRSVYYNLGARAAP